MVERIRPSPDGKKEVDGKEEECASGRPGDLVLLVDENTTRVGWPTGRVIETTTSSTLGAETVRSVKVRTETGEYRRPITKLCLLQTIDEQGSPEMVDDVTDQPIHKNELATRK
jgi:hypothetical protein